MLSRKRPVVGIGDHLEYRKRRRLDCPFTSLQKRLANEHRNILRENTAHKIKIQQLQWGLDQAQQRNHALQYKLDGDVNIRAQDQLQKAKYLLEEMNTEYLANMQGMEYEIEQKENAISYHQHHVEILLSLVKDKDDEIRKAKNLWFIREHLMEKEQEELMTELEVKDHMNEIKHKDNERKNNSIISQLIDQIQYSKERMQTELKSKEDEIQTLQDQLQIKDYEHDEEIKRLDKEYTEKKKKVFCFAQLSTLDRQQMVTTQKHLDELLKRESLCSICVDSEKNMAINPCGHQFCNSCTNRFGIRCPVCKGFIISKISLMRT